MTDVCCYNLYLTLTYLFLLHKNLPVGIKTSCKFESPVPSHTKLHLCQGVGVCVYIYMLTHTHNMAKKKNL